MTHTNDKSVNQLREEGYVVVVWGPEDIGSIRDWGEPKCIKELEKIQKPLTSRSIELGWDVIEQLLPEN